METYVIEKTKYDGMRFEDINWLLKAKSNEKTSNYQYVFVKDGIMYATDGPRMHILDCDTLPDGVYDVLTRTRKQIIFKLHTNQFGNTFDIFGQVLNYKRRNGIEKYNHHQRRIFSLFVHYVYEQTGQCFNVDYLNDAVSGMDCNITFDRPQKGWQKNPALYPVIFGNDEKIALIMPLKLN